MLGETEGEEAMGIVSKNFIYLAAVRGLIVRSKYATDKILLNKPFTFRIEAEAFCTARGYLCRTTLLHLKENQRLVAMDSENYKSSFTILKMQHE